VRVNGGLAGASVGGETSASASCETVLVLRAAPSERCRTGLDPGWRESVARRSPRSPKATRWSRNRGRRPTGFYEGSLSMEGTSGHHEPASFTSGWSRWPRQHPPDGKLERRAGREGDSAIPRKRMKRQGCQRLDRIGRRGKKTPTLDSTTPKEQESRQRVSGVGPPKRSRVS
jgi:hypothetical protein